LNTPPKSRENTQTPESGGHKSGHKDARFGHSPGPATPTESDLAAVVAAWPDLPPAVRAGIVAMVRAAAGKA
jgi:hypothetical protein